MMMVPALGMLYLEIQFLANLFVDDTPIRTLPVGMDYRGRSEADPRGPTVRPAGRPGRRALCCPFAATH